jgi:iron(III) transport system permease protein
MWGWRSSRTWVIAAATLIFLLGCVVPLASLLLELLRRPDALASLAIDARQRGLLLNTAVLGVGTAVLSTLIGAPLGILLGRIATRRKALLRLALGAPAVIPPYVVALTFVYAGGAEWTFSLAAAVMVLAVVFYPLSMLATELGLRRIDARLEEAAIIVAPPGRVLRFVTFPLAAPVTLAAAFLIFVLAISEFGVPGLLRVRVYTTEVFTAFAALYDVTRAIALTVPLLVLCAGLAALGATLAGDRLVTTRRGTSASTVLFDPWGPALRTVAAVVIAIALMAPLLILLREVGWVESSLAIVLGSGRAIVKSLVLAALGATLVVGLATLLGYARARLRRHVGRAADVLLIALFAIPSTVVGVALIDFWNKPGPLGAIYGTDGMFLLTYVARFLPAAVLILGATARYVPVSHEEAAAVTGSSWPRTMARIVLPQMRLGIAATWVIVFVLAFGELGASILITPPGEATLPIRIYTLIANAPTSQVAAFALLQTLVIISALAALAAMAERRATT